MGGFTPEQEAFLRHDPEKSGRLIAGPGAGKSFTCVAYMEEYTNPDRNFPARIRMLTFTRAAAAEFAETMERQGLGEGIQPPSTIHAFALAIIRKLGWTEVPQPVRIVDAWEAQTLVRPQLSRLLKARGFEEATPGAVEALEREMGAGFESLDPSHVLLGDMRPELRNAYQGLWAEHRARLGYLLLGELPYRAGMAVEDLGIPDLNLDLLLVDEYQDLNRADIHLIHLVAEGGLAVVAIGDEDQSIYGWRHAAPQGIRDFPNDFGVDAGDDYTLTVSRRCGAAILDAAQTLIEQAPDRPRRAPMMPFDPLKPGTIQYLRFANMAQEASCVAAILAARIRAGVAPRKIAVLARMSIDKWDAALRPKLEENGMAIASDAWVDRAISDVGLLRLRALAHLSSDIDDSLAWMTLIELEPQLGEKAMDALYQAVSGDETFAVTVRRVGAEGLDGMRKQSLARLQALVERTMREIEPFARGEGEEINNWGEWLIGRATNALSDDAARLLRVAGSVLTTLPLEGFLAQLEPTGRDFALGEQDAVRLLTIQGSKGLTFDTAVIVGVEEAFVPRPGSDINEERRLLYVAMTRATDYCLLSFSTERNGPLAFSGRQVAGGRTRSSLLQGVIAPRPALPWLREQGWI
jgi:DNA helicase-2/ATP-dependent DNA helicase PcrA